MSYPTDEEFRAPRCPPPRCDHADGPKSPVPHIIMDRPRDQETTIADPKTGGMKNSKLPQLGTLCPLAIMEVARVGGFGCSKYERYNFLKGYRWSLSYDAAQRHLHEAWAGETFVTDDEKAKPHRLYHFAAAAWHCLALLAFQIRGIGTDDRPPKCDPLGDPQNKGR